MQVFCASFFQPEQWALFTEKAKKHNLTQSKAEQFRHIFFSTRA